MSKLPGKGANLFVGDAIQLAMLHAVIYLGDEIHELRLAGLDG